MQTVVVEVVKTRIIEVEAPKASTIEIVDYTEQIEVISVGIQGPVGPGSGDVLGPSSTDNERVAIFDGMTGKRIKQHSRTIGQIETDIARRVKKLSGPEFTYNLDGNITNIVYDDGSTKVFTYTGTRLDRIDFTQEGVTIRKDFNYTGLILNSITETVI